MKKYYIIIISCLVFALWSCQEPFTPSFANEEPVVVIEGYIQKGVRAAPTIVSISKTYALFNKEQKNLESYLGGAKVLVKHQGETYPLTEVCTKDLDPALFAFLQQQLAIDSSLLNLDLCFYIDIAQSIPKNENLAYDLEVQFENKQYTATTTIPSMVPVDSIVLVNKTAVDDLNAKYKGMEAYLTDPAGDNYYRLKINKNGGPYTNRFSVTDDKIFNGSTFKFEIRSQERDVEDARVRGLFSVGDTIGIQWQMIDEAQFDFWNTLEFSRNNQGPFASYTRTLDNIDGGIGIWGGSTIEYYNVIIK